MSDSQTTRARFNRHRVVFAFAAIFLAPSSAAAQQRFRTPQGIVEVVGLRRWTVQMIQDSAARYAPGQDLASHACAAVLRLKLKFADASVVYYRTDTVFYRTDSIYYRTDTVSSGGVLIVSVIEPQDSALVRYKPRYHDSLPVRPEWRTAVDVFENHNHAFQTAVQSPGFLTGDTIAPGFATQLYAALPLRSFVRARQSPHEFQLALATLAGDGNSRNRVAAAVLLANFAASDSSWWALLDALRDPTAFVGGTASQVLSMLVRSTPRRVDWAPVAATARALLDGTNLFAHNDVMTALAATDVSPVLAPRLLGGGGVLVLAKLGSSDPSGRVGAHRLLVRLSGRDYGFTVDEWRRWIASL